MKSNSRGQKFSLVRLRGAMVVGQPVAVAEHAHQLQLWVVQRAIGESEFKFRGEPLVMTVAAGWCKCSKHVPTERCRQATHEGCAAFGSKLGR